MKNALVVFKLGLGLLDFIFPSFFVSVQSCCSTTAVIVNSCTSCITGCCTISDICNYEIIHCHLYKNTIVLTYLCHLILLCIYWHRWEEFKQIVSKAIPATRFNHNIDKYKCKCKCKYRSHFVDHTFLVTVPSFKLRPSHCLRRWAGVWKDSSDLLLSNFSLRAVDRLDVHGHFISPWLSSQDVSVTRSHLGAQMKAQICFSTLGFTDPVTASITTKEKEHSLVLR